MSVGDKPDSRAANLTNATARTGAYASCNAGYVSSCGNSAYDYGAWGCGRTCDGGRWTNFWCNQCCCELAVTSSPTPYPTPFPTPSPTPSPTPYPTPFPTPFPTSSLTTSPTASPTPSPTVTKRKLLCLHGYGNSAEKLSTVQIVDLMSQWGDRYECVYAEGPYVGYGYGSEGVGMNYHSWLPVPVTFSWGVPNIDMWGETTDENIGDAAVDILQAIVQSQGPFYGILGFSQGGSIIPYFLTQVPPGTFEAVILFCSFLPYNHAGLMDDINAAAPFDLRTLVYMGGLLDTFVSQDKSYALAAAFVDPVIIVDDSNAHTVPTTSNTKFSDVVAFLDASATPNPTPSPTLSPTGPGSAGMGGVSATGDPHLQNIHGEKFDLMKPGKHLLIQIPRDNSQNTLLRVNAEAQTMGGQCTDMYFQELNITGAWADAKQAGGFSYHAQNVDGEFPHWAKFGSVHLKVALGHTRQGIKYLNFYVKNLAHAGFAVGGLLGEGDHKEAAKPPESCVRRLSFVDASFTRAR